MALSLTNFACVKLSSGLSFHDCGSFSKSYRVTVYSTVAFGGMLNFSLPAAPNAWSDFITSLQQPISKFELNEKNEQQLWPLPWRLAFAKMKKSRLNTGNDLVVGNFANVERCLTIVENSILVFTNQMHCNCKYWKVDWKCSELFLRPHYITLHVGPIVRRLSCGTFFDHMPQDASITFWTQIFWFPIE